MCGILPSPGPQDTVVRSKSEQAQGIHNSHLFSNAELKFKGVSDALEL